MKELPLREAKTTLSAVVKAAENGEPTMITKHGRAKLKTRVPSFADLLLAVPRLEPGDLPKRRPARIVRKGGFGCWPDTCSTQMRCRFSHRRQCHGPSGRYRAIKMHRS